MGYSEREIGIILNKPVGTIKSRIYYARRALAQTLGRKEDTLQ